jgi:hypothetical protein
MKIMCSMCGQVKNADQFYYNKRKKRYNSYCMNCNRLYIKEYMRIYRERKKANG